jgi:hypothetical protein
MKVAIIYDDFDVAIKASATLRQPVNQSGLAIEWHISPWRAGILKFPPVATEALMDAAEAHLIVFAGTCARPIPAWLLNWLERWVTLRQVKDAVLAVISADGTGSFLLSASSDVARFARRHGLDYISDTGVASGDVLEFLTAPLIGQELAVPAGAYRGWNIN